MDTRNYMTMRLDLKFDDCIRTNVWFRNYYLYGYNVFVFLIIITKSLPVRRECWWKSFNAVSHFSLAVEIVVTFSIPDDA